MQTQMRINIIYKIIDEKFLNPRGSACEWFGQPLQSAFP
jgi:hypothetical protein